MLLQQFKTWSDIRTLRSRFCISRASMGSLSSSMLFDTPGPIVPECNQTAESDANAVTCSDATTIRAMPSSLPRSITASTITEGINDYPRGSKPPEVRNLPQLDPQPSKRAKPQLLRTASNVSAIMRTFNYHAPVHIAVASCLPHQDMWLPCELAERVEIPARTFLEANEHVYHNPHDMLGSVSNTPDAAQRLKDPSWVEERDKDILREYFLNPTNIVLHSDCPHIAPHIVITPAEETPDDFYTPWNNRTLPQWSGFLMVPPYDLATGRLHPSTYPPLSQDLDPFNDGVLVDKSSRDKNNTLVPPDPPKPVFCHSRFSSFVERTANERLILYHVVKALQRHQCKAAAYAASARARILRQRYETRDLASIEQPFVWTDPAEPLLLSFKHMLGATVLESSSPFTAPHIIINSPPPQNPWIPWHNAVNDPQDGRYLVVPSPRVNFVNMDDEEPQSRWTSSSAASSRFFIPSDEEEDDGIRDDFDYEDEDDLDMDHSESPPPSRPGSPGPETPTDDSLSMRSFFSVRRPSFVIDEDDEDDRALALAIAKTAVEEYYHATSLRVPLPVIEEEVPLDAGRFLPVSSMQVATSEDEDLPPLDDWYTGASSRTLAPTVAVV